MKVRYIGQSFGIDGLTNKTVYEVIGIEPDVGALRIIDDSGEDYLYSPINPRPLSGDGPGGKFEVVEDDEKGTLRKIIHS
jgi:hypothetical protein